jgi:Fic family protein
MAGGAVTTARKLEEISLENRARIQALGRVSGSALRIHQVLQRQPLVSIPRLVAETRLSAPTAASALAALVKAGIAREVTGRKRNRIFAYERYLAILWEGTDGK